MMGRDGWVYAAREDDAPLVKLGFTRLHPSARIQRLRYQYHAPITLLGAVHLNRLALYMERALHKTLAPYRIEGEWFYLHMNQAILEALVQHVMPAVLAQVEADEAEAERVLSRRDNSPAIAEAIVPLREHIAQVAQRYHVEPADIVRMLRKDARKAAPVG
jgi:hypothetical protein